MKTGFSGGVDMGHGRDKHVETTVVVSANHLVAISKAQLRTAFLNTFSGNDADDPDSNAVFEQLAKELGL